MSIKTIENKNKEFKENPNEYLSNIFSTNKKEKIDFEVYLLHTIIEIL